MCFSQIWCFLYFLSNVHFRQNYLKFLIIWKRNFSAQLCGSVDKDLMLIVLWLLANCFLPRNFLHFNLAKVNCCNSWSMWCENTYAKYVLVFFGGAFLENVEASYCSSINWKWRETWTHMPTKLGLADPVANWRYWASEETGWGIMECKWNDRQGQKGQNCHVVLSGFTNGLTEEKAGSQTQRVRRSYGCGREIYESVGNFVRNFFLCSTDGLFCGICCLPFQ